MFDRDEDGLLDPDELAAVVQQIEEAKANGNSVETTRKEAAIAEARRIFELKDGEKLSLVNFLTAVGNLRFRGTSLLFRAPHSIFERLDTSLYDHSDSITKLNIMIIPHLKKSNISSLPKMHLLI